LDIYFLTEKSTKDIVLTLIDSLNKDETINGVMIQMPLPENLKDNKAELIKSIDQEKDVDGLRENSKFLHPTSRAIIEIIDNAKSEINLKDDLTYVVVGATGMVGAPLSKELKKKGLRVIECDNKTRDLKAQTLKADILVSATGVHDLIREDMVGNGVSIIDVGYPKGDVDFDTVSKKSSFITPVPGGVGPVTITCLLENLVEACYNPSS
jgi:methylenetetrahydrofolate dehydrogenase (NADP+)/methenyltetrahydrofolate cyclohydrolase